MLHSYKYCTLRERFGLGRLNISNSKKMEINKFYIFFFTSVFLINSYHAQEVIEIPTATDAYLLSYTLDEENSIVTFEVTAETKGFIGFGFSNISGMVQADIFIGGVNEDGTSYFGVSTKICSLKIK